MQIVINENGLQRALVDNHVKVIYTTRDRVGTTDLWRDGEQVRAAVYNTSIKNLYEIAKGPNGGTESPTSIFVTRADINSQYQNTETNDGRFFSKVGHDELVIEKDIC